MKFHELHLQGAFLVELEPIQDSRGFLARVFSESDFQRAGFPGRIVQMNHTLTRNRGTVRGLHYQLPPSAECRVVKCIRGSVFDVIVDIRAGSSTFLQWAGAELSDRNLTMMFVPIGFAHGFQTLEEGCELLYMHSGSYSPEHERGLRADDPRLGIAWPLPIAYRSERDLHHPPIEINNFRGVIL